MFCNCVCAGNKFYSQLCSFWKCIPKVKLALLVLFLLLPAISISCTAVFKLSLTNQLIAIDQTILLQPMGYHYWCKGFSVSEHVIGYSDNVDGFNVSAFLVDDSAVKIENYTVGSDRYPGVNRPIDGDKQRYKVPLNYYSDPLYLLKGSTMYLQSVIYLPKENANTVYSAIVHIFDSEEEADEFERGEISANNQVYYLNVTNCVRSVCTRHFTVAKNSFYFFVLSSDSTSAFNITTNFTFQVLRFVYPFSHSSASNVANVSKNASGFIPFHRHKQILLYTNKPNGTITSRLCHLNVTCVPRRWLQAGVIVLSFLPLTIYTIIIIVLLCVHNIKHLCLRCYHHLHHKQRNTREETISLLQ